jgi:hypothetical protein
MVWLSSGPPRNTAVADSVTHDSATRVLKSDMVSLDACLPRVQSFFLSIQLARYRMHLSTEAIIAIVTLFVMCLPPLSILLTRLWRSRHNNIPPSSMLISASPFLFL